MARGRHAIPAAGAFGGVPYGATILVRGVPKWPRGRSRHSALQRPAAGAALRSPDDEGILRAPRVGNAAARKTTRPNHYAAACRVARVSRHFRPRPRA
eukprot:9061005-Pyramimonas_sp.AAC.1